MYEIEYSYTDALNQDCPIQPPTCCAGFGWPIIVCCCFCEDQFCVNLFQDKRQSHKQFGSSSERRFVRLGLGLKCLKELSADEGRPFEPRHEFSGNVRPAKARTKAGQSLC